MIGIDYGMFPPDYNSARMYAGAGSGPMLAAAAAWSELATNLSSAATSYASVVSGLTGGPWLGTASMSMAAAAASYVGYLNATAAHAAQTAGSAQAAASAYEAAHAATVPPPVVATNRAQLAALVATNILGQNTPAIMATEAEYAEMWAQDAGAMYGYSANVSATTAQVTPWTPALQNTNLAGVVAQHTAVAGSALNAAGNQAQTMSAVPQALQSLASPAASTSSATGASGALSGLLGGSSSSTSSLGQSLLMEMLPTLVNPADLSLVMYPGVYGAMLPTQMMGVFSQMARAGAAPALGQIAANAAKPLQLLGHGLGGMAGLGSGLHPPMSAGMGQANLLGGLSVPRSWTAATPINPAAMSPGAVGGAIPGTAGGPAGMYGGVPWGAPGAGHGLGFGGVNSALKVGPRRFVMPRPSVAG